MAEYEYMLHTWGGFYNEEYQKVHGQKPGYFWYLTAGERDAYVQRLQKIEEELDVHILMSVLKEGKDTRLRTVASMIFVFNGKEYPYVEDFGYAYDPASAEYMFQHGSYSCDCNRSLFLSRRYPEFPEMSCGKRIEMRDFKVSLVPGTKEPFEESW